MTKPRNLVQSYIDHHGDTRSAVAAINEALGTSYPVSRIYDWRNGNRSIPQPVQDWMLRCCLEGVIRHYGGRPPADERMEHCAEALCPPRRYD